jgi:SAM-dependent methyltransferase
MVDGIKFMLKKLYAFLIENYSSKEDIFLKFLSILLRNSKTILDIGCGPAPYLTKITKYDFVCGIDAHYDTCIRVNNSKVYNYTINAITPHFPIKRKSFDAVVLFQIIEHIPKDEGLILLQQAENIAKRMIIVTTPNGFVEQEAYDNNPFQKHKSGWVVSDFRKLGFKVYGLEGFKFLYKKEKSIPVFPKLLWSKLINLGLFEGIIRNRPNMAFQLIAIKKLKSDNMN